MGGENSLPLILMHVLGKIGVPVFMFISGFYGVKYKRGRLIDILLQSVLYTIVFYAIFCLWLPIFSLRQAVLQIFGLSGIWFVYCYVVLYIFSDGINEVLDSFDFKSFSFVVSIFLFIAIGKWIGKEGGCNLFTMIEYYVVARYVRRFANTWKTCIKWLMLPSVVVFIAPICYGYYSGHYSAIYPYVFSYYNPMLILMAMSAVVLADDYKTNYKAVNYVAGSVLAVYMLHENCYTPQLVNAFFHFDNFNPCRAVVLIVLIFAVAVCIDKLRLKITSYLLK